MASPRQILYTSAFFVTDDLEETVRYYRDVLGFKTTGYNYLDGRKVLTRLDRDGVLIAFQQARGGAPLQPNHAVADDFTDDGVRSYVVDLIIGVVDVSTYFAEVAAKGAKVIKEPTEDYMPSFIVEECNSYRLQFYEVPFVEQV
jgi:catechol 2,3-dioxygenase-like lactoylglutathione lyase family enzyme